MQTSSIIDRDSIMATLKLTPPAERAEILDKVMTCYKGMEPGLAMGTKVVIYPDCNFLMALMKPEERRTQWLAANVMLDFVQTLHRQQIGLGLCPSVLYEFVGKDYVEPSLAVMAAQVCTELLRQTKMQVSIPHPKDLTSETYLSRSFSRIRHDEQLLLQVVESVAQIDCGAMWERARPNKLLPGFAEAVVREAIKDVNLHYFDAGCIVAIIGRKLYARMLSVCPEWSGMASFVHGDPYPKIKNMLDIDRKSRVSGLADLDFLSLCHAGHHFHNRDNTGWAVFSFDGGLAQAMAASGNIPVTETLPGGMSPEEVKQQVSNAVQSNLHRLNAYIDRRKGTVGLFLHYLTTQLEDRLRSAAET